MQEKLTLLSDRLLTMSQGYAGGGSDMTADALSIVDETLSANTLAKQLIQDGSDTEKATAYGAMPSINESVKQLLLLARDTQLERLKADVLLEDNLTSTEAITALVQDGNALYAQALESSSEEVKSTLSYYENPTNQRVALEQSQTVQAPLDVYAEQLSMLKKQLTEIYQQKPTVETVQRDLKGIKQLLLDKLLRETRQYDQLSQELDQIAEKLNTVSDKDQLNSELNIALEKVQQDGSSSAFLDEASRRIGLLKSHTLLVGTDGGSVVTRTVDFKTAMENWMDVQFVPQLVEITDASRQLQTRVSMALHNIKNRLSITNENTRESVMTDISGVMSGLKQDIDKVQMLIANNCKVLSNLVNEEVRFSKLYQNEEFLKLGLQGSINQVVKHQNERVQSVTNWIKEKWQKAQLTAQEWRYPTHLSQKEAIAACLGSRQVNKTTEIYDQVFQNNPFISEVFIVPRSSEINQIKKATEHWKAGGNVSVILTGVSLCGKTTMLNQVRNNLFPKNNIHLQPDSEIKHAGNVIKTTKALKNALEQAKKYATSGKTMISIDDLELWQDKDHSILQNVSDLIAFINRYGHQVLVVATMGSRLYHRLNSYISIADKLYTTIDLSKCTLQEAIKTINIRHAATHKTLINKDNTPLSPTETQRLIRRMYHDAYGNIGDILQKWTYSTHDIDDNEVTFRYEHIDLPDIQTSDNQALVDTLLQNKKLRHKDLISRYGREVYESMRPTIQRLTNDRIVTIDATEHLSINPSIVNELEHALYRENIHSSNYQKINLI